MLLTIFSPSNMPYSSVKKKKKNLYVNLAKFNFCGKMDSFFCNLIIFTQVTYKRQSSEV